MEFSRDRNISRISQTSKIEGKKKKTVKRIGNLIDEICDYSNVCNSFQVVMRGTKRKKSRIGRKIMNHKEEVIRMLQEQIRSGEFCISGYKEMTIKDGPKERTVQSVPLIERIGCNAVMSVVEKKIHSRYIRTTSASIKNRGVHDLLGYIRKDLENYPENMRYAYKFDIRKFYESISQDFMMYALRRMFKDKTLLTIMERFVRMMPNGLSIGLRSSQGFGNMLLSMFLDHYLKDEKGYLHFYRYCDDGDIHFATKEEVWQARDEIHKRVEMMQLEVKGNERVFPVREGIDFLGYVIYPTHIRLRKRNKQNAARKLHKIKSKKRQQEIIASLYGQCKHGDCANLFYKITGIKMKDFKSLGIKPRFTDGKKRFEGALVRLSELVNLPIEVHDFETGILPQFLKEKYNRQVAEAQRDNLPTESIEKPQGRYVVSVKVNGVMKKFITASKEMCSILDQARDMNAFPFTTVIKSELYGTRNNEVKYYFA